MATYTPDEMLSVFGFSVDINGDGSDDFSPDPTFTAPGILPTPLNDADGTLTQADGLGSFSGGFAAAANS